MKHNRTIPDGITDPAQYERIARARAICNLDTRTAFYGSLAARLRLVERADIETAATDGRSIFYNPGFLAGLSDAALVGLWIHEIRHCTDLHFTRRPAHVPADEWNIVTDLAINADILGSGFVLPDGALFEPRFAGWSPEQIHAELYGPKSAKPEPEPGDGEPGDKPEPDDGDKPGTGAGEPGTGAGEAGDGAGDGSGNGSGEPGDGTAAGEPGTAAGAGSRPGNGAAATDKATAGNGRPGAGPRAGIDPGRCGAVVEPDPAMYQDADGVGDGSGDPSAVAADWQVYTRQAIAVAAKAAGGLPGDLERLAGDLNANRVDWRDVLRRFIDDTSTRVSTWDRPSRKHVARGLYLPGRKSAALSRLVVIRDTSGSVDDRTLTAFMSEMSAAWDDGAAERMTIIDCDLRIHRIVELEPGEPFPVKLAPRGGGGTAFAPALAHVADMIPDAAAVVYFTDMICERSRMGADPGVPVLWAVWGRPSTWKRYADGRPCGELIHVDG